ncbi:uncharacterized protein LOC135709910 [Ochlerotatus camptorhynchus]|uniref:uncharacterized protein LOC135709910 n=1 Tax=Ochlerotatus camptorhynchus TaxID=644619 RepID=UPI0031DA414B
MNLPRRKKQHRQPEIRCPKQPVPCSGCGALLQCAEPCITGLYLRSKRDQSEPKRKTTQAPNQKHRITRICLTLVKPSPTMYDFAAMSTERRIKTLKMRLKSIVTSLNLIKTFVDDYDEETQADEVPVRLESLIKMWSDYNTFQSELETLDEAAIEAHLKERASLESAYYHVKGFLLARNKTPITPTRPFPNHSETQFLPSASQVRLPDVKLPVFDGKLENWLNFHDLYVSLVHSAVGLSNIQKFYYLRSSLSNTALQLIQTIPICANNYPVAWNLLLEHFQNPARLKQAYVDTLFDFASIKRETATELHSLVEKFEANVKVLQQLGERTEYWDILLIRMLSTQLDPTTRRDWEEYSSTKPAITFKDLTSFIQRRVTVLQSIQAKPIEAQSSTVQKKPVQRSVSSHGANQVNLRKCVVCSDHHPLYMCGIFSQLSIEEKEKEIRRHQLCRNCLRKGHLSRDCSSSTNCRKCRGRHHTQLCSNDSSFSSNSKPVQYPKPATPTPATIPPTMSSSVTVVESISYASAGHKKKTVLLATAMIILIDDNGVEYVARALLDSGSECCFITERFSQRIKAQRKKIYLPISGIGQASTQARLKFSSTIRSRVGTYSTSVEFLVLPKVTIDLPATSVDTSTWDMPPSIQLADPSFDSTNPIDVIIGAEIFFDLFKVPGRIPLGDNLPVLLNSVFGWVVAGKSTMSPSTALVVANVATVADIHQLMEKFWTIEEDSTSTAYSVEEAACEEHFSRTVARTPEGRYVVRLPFKEEVINQVGDNRRTAVRRFHLLQGRLIRNPDLHQQYKAFIDEYLDLGHMKRIHDYEDPEVQHYYLPHHAVIREESTTTKLRVVFDASCKTPNGPSLNDALMVGPTVQEDIRSITMRSRKHQVMVVADAKMMYRQVLVDPRDCRVQLIVWKPSPDHPMETYQLNTVTYGTASAPFLATRVLIQLADDEGQCFPLAAKALKKDVYVDDLFSGGRNAAEVIELRNQLDALLAKGGFQLRKWASNDEVVLKGIPPENRALKTSVDLDRDQVIKTLGLHWEPASDCLRYKIDLPSDTADQPITKRIALSLIARLYDPLGLVGPVVTAAKVFMQNLWKLKDDSGSSWSWDKELPMEYQIHWTNYQSKLPRLNELRIERCILQPEPATIQIHIFADASQLAYGACAYVRSTNASGIVKVALLTAKSRVAPLKRQSIPRLELSGALLAAQLYEKVQSSLRLDAKCYFWLDSTVVLCWLNASPSTWNTFVANRTSKIQLTTQNSSWNHVAGLENPADCISRGITADTIIDFDIWWQGPEWLRQPQDCWPVAGSTHDQPSEALEEARRISLAVSSSPNEPSFVDLLVEKFSEYRYLLRIVAYCRRFLQSCRKQSSGLPNSTLLKVEEIEEWKQLQQSEPVSMKSRLKWFHPFISSEKVIRIGGRLEKAEQPYDSKHQILLPASHKLSLLLVRSYHERHLHAAPQLLLNLLRQRYWIIGARNMAKRVVHTCVTCFRARPRMLEQFMAELPASRTTASRPFTITGVDYWGPISLKPIHRRAAPGKAYVAVFICFSTKAVHLELVADLSTPKFLQALRRFVSRRGLCSDLHSDNGRNFVGANNELRDLVRNKEHRNAIAQECNLQGIRWHFNPPRASHFGGLWEAAIKSAQKHFVRVLGKHTLAYDDMTTLLCQIESCLNSRPIVPLSDDPSDFEPLTPGHFLTGSALKAVPDVNYIDIPTNRLRQWHLVQKLFQELWKRWHLEYLSTLQPRTKWCNPPIQLQQNQLVVLRDENTAPMHWQTARIDQVHPGSDGVIRVVTVQTPTGRYVRPVSKICLLPVQSSSDQNQPPQM